LVEAQRLDQSGSRSAVGADDGAVKLKNLCVELGNGVADLVTDPTRPTTMKTRYVSGQQQMLRVDHESSHEINQILEQQVIEKVKSHLPQVQAIILSDYAKGFLTPRISAETIRLARAQKIPVLVDPKGRNYTAYKGATVLSPNLKELTDVTGQSCKTEDGIIAAAKYLQNEFEVQNVLATRGKDGMSLIASDNSLTHLRAEAREVYDVSGAGDTVIATMAAALAVGATPIAAAQLANVAAGIVVAKLGTAVALPSEIDVALLEQEGRSQRKVYELSALLDRIKVWRKQGLTIGFTNGCFDLIHPGHVALLRGARAACDRLILGLNSDDSVKRLKGPTRPVQNQDSRATVLSSLDSVDGVVIFDEDTPVKLIEAIKPEILVKGTDYTVETVVGSAFVQAYGGKIVLVPLEEGHSTSNTVKRIANA
jgi:D-beta-D-heptose 7-phosphate kinase/D-beta-D-heptose 1-phosphate adenosyltransferase